MIHIEKIHIPKAHEVRYNWEYMCGTYDLQKAINTNHIKEYGNINIVDEYVDTIIINKTNTRQMSRSKIIKTYNRRKKRDIFIDLMEDLNNIQDKDDNRNRKNTPLVRKI
jgi:hypothetical protein